MTPREAAIEYCRRGWSVIPIRFEGTVEDRKKPLLLSWEIYQKKAASEAQVEKWFQQWPKANVGLVMGSVSGLVALDLDGPHAMDLLRHAKIDLPDTASVQTSRGYHLVFAHPGYTVSNRVKLLSGGESGVDIRGDGGYIVAPPSVHGSGAIYQWVVPVERIAPLPNGIAALLSRKAQRDDAEGDGSWFETAWRGVGDGQRNDTAARLAGWWLHKTKGDVHAAYYAMMSWAERCSPPMALHELKTTIRSVARLEAAKQNHEQVKTFHKHVVVEGPEWAEHLRKHKPEEGTPVNVPGFDLLRGLVPGRLIFLAGRPGAGKSSLSTQLTVEACFMGSAHTPTLVISTEMTLNDWGTWMASYLAHKETHLLPHPLPESILQFWGMSPVAIVDSGTMSIQDIRHIAESRVGLKLLIVDNTTRIVGGRKDSRTLEIGDVARGLKGIARDMNCTVVALVHMNRLSETSGRTRPRLSDLRDSGEIEQEADAVMFLWNKEKEDAKFKSIIPTILTVEKNRHGRTGDVHLMFNKPAHTFTRKEQP